MLFRAFAAQKINLNLAVALLLLSPQCPTAKGGIKIAQTDRTAPALTLIAGQRGGPDVAVSGGGSAQSMNLRSKTEPLNLRATAQDNESGVQALEVWVNTKTTSCDAAGICTTQGPGLLGRPTFDLTEPRKKPGETTLPSSFLSRAFDLTKEIPQAGVPAGHSRTVTLIIHAVAVNHLGGRTQTPELTATWREAAPSPPPPTPTPTRCPSGLKCCGAVIDGRCDGDCVRTDMACP